MTKSRANDQQYSHLHHQQTLLQLLYLQQYHELCYWIYIHTDALGSVDTVTDNHGAIVLRNEYTPYGENITNLADASSYNHLFANEELRGYTGHRQIPEANLINMNARIYDPFIARFTSPDTMIPHPDMIQSYNRYAYVYGNPIKYSDPSGHFIQFIVGAIFVAIAASSDNPTVQKIGMAVGSMMMFGGVDLGSPFVNGAVVGFTKDFIASGGDFGQAIQGAVTSAMSAAGAEGVADHFGHEWSIEGALAHGITQGAIGAISGGSFKGGFISAFVSKVTSAGLRTWNIAQTRNADGTLTESARLGGLAINMMLGGLASEASGGSFNEGALSAAVVYLYNDIWDEYAAKIAFGEDKNDPKIEFSDEFISKTNSKVGDHLILISSDKHNISILKVPLIKTKLISAEGKVGHGVIPNIDVIKNMTSLKKFKIGFKAGGGFNTLEGKAGASIKFFNIKISGGLQGAMGGLSAKAEVSLSASKGFKIDILLVPLIGGGGYFNVTW